jgi:hypothetical protein
MNVGAKKSSYFGPMIFSSNFLVHPLIVRAYAYKIS